MKPFLLALLGCALLSLPAAADDQKTNYDPEARQKPMQVITKLDRSIDDDAWVTIVYEIDNAQSKMLVPLLRPLVPQNGHLVAHPESNMLLITDRYANVRKLIEIVRIMDSATPRQQRQ